MRRRRQTEGSLAASPRSHSLTQRRASTSPHSAPMFPSREESLTDPTSPDEPEDVSNSCAWTRDKYQETSLDLSSSPQGLSALHSISQTQAVTAPTKKRKLSRQVELGSREITCPLDVDQPPPQGPQPSLTPAAPSWLRPPLSRQKPKGWTDRPVNAAMVPSKLRQSIEQTGFPSVIIAYDATEATNAPRRARLLPLQLSYPDRFALREMQDDSSSEERPNRRDKTSYKHFSLANAASSKSGYAFPRVSVTSHSSSDHYANERDTFAPGVAQAAPLQPPGLAPIAEAAGTQGRAVAVAEPDLNDNRSPLSIGSSCNTWNGRGKGKARTDRLPHERLPATPPLDTSRIPVEIFEHISSHLSRNDVRNMRLVNLNFEAGVSPSLFKSVVVPFNTKVYGKLGEPEDRKDMEDERDSYHIKRAPSTIDLDIFPGFGVHIRQFGMSFDIDLVDLASPPTKNIQEPMDSYWGIYKWPFRYYRRFQDRADLENAADETSTMKLAFSHLSKIKHLALSLDCGLGWMNGLDHSIRAQIMQRPVSIFGSSFFDTDTDVATRRRLWSLIESAYKAINCYDDLKVAELVRHLRLPDNETAKIERSPRTFNVNQSLVSGVGTDRGAGINASRPASWSQLQSPSKTRAEARVESRADTVGGNNMRERVRNILLNIGNDHNNMDNEHLIDEYVREAFDDSWTAMGRTNLLSRIESTRLYTGDTSTGEDDTEAEGLDGTRRGLLYTRPVYQERRRTSHIKPLVNPSNLSTPQKEWLLETAWAQDAFLSSYMIAVTDDPSIFANISKMTISKLSSKHVTKLCRSDFWDALSNLKELEIKVVPDHRDVQKTQAGFAIVPTIEPSKAVTIFHYLLNNLIGFKKSLEVLSLGWTDGGEHAEGVHVRNRLLMPAPLLPREAMADASSLPQNMLKLPYIKKLELVNCWTTPTTFQSFVLAMRNEQLEKLTLNSFSLTGMPGQDQPANGAVAHLQALQQLVAQQMAMFPAAPAQHGQGNTGHAYPNLLPVPNNANNVGQAIQTLQQLLADPNNPWNQQNWPVGGQQMGPLIGGAVQLQPQAHLYPYPIQNGQAHAHMLGNQNALPNLHALNLQAGAAGVNFGNPVGGHPLHTPSLPRSGSWPQVLNRIKGVLNLRENTDFEVKFYSCGYARLPLSSRFDQSAFDEAEAIRDMRHPLPKKLTIYAATRKKILESYIASAPDVNLGTVVTALPAHELQDLMTDWGFAPGWPTLEILDSEYNDDEGWGRWGSKTKEGPQFDGQRAGGTGRFSGRVTDWLVLVDDSE